MDQATMRAMIEATRIGRLATVTPAGAPHVVPICFVLAQDTVFSVVDHKPKRSPRLQRLINLEHESRCALLVDRYDDDWSQLWWVRLDGRGRVSTKREERAAALHLLAARYPQYAARTPTGDVLAVDILRWTGWSGATQ